MVADHSIANKGDDRFQRLFDASKAVHSSLDAPAALELIVSEAARLTGANIATLSVINPITGLLEMQAAVGLRKSTKSLSLRLGQGVTGWVAKSGLPARVNDVRSDPRFIPASRTTLSEMAVPLKINGEIRGAINVESRRQNAFSAEDERSLVELADLASGVVFNSWRFEQLRLKARLFEALNAINRSINASLGLEDILATVAREASGLLKCRLCTLMLVDKQAEALILKSWHFSDFGSRPPENVPISDSIFGVVVRRKKPIALDHFHADPHLLKNNWAKKEKLQSLLCVPLLHLDRCVGVLTVYRSDRYRFSNEEIAVLSSLADLTAIAIEKSGLYERIAAMEDELRHSDKLSALGLLSAEIAHEIRNPLTVIKLLFHSLMLDFPSDDPRSRDSKLIASKIDHLNDFLDKMLVFSKLSEPSFSSVNVNSLIEELSLLVRHKLSSNSIILQLKLDRSIPAISADPRQIEQVLLNLILNAVEAMPDGGRLHISSRFLKKNNGLSYVVISVRDSGPGIPGEIIKSALAGSISSTKALGAGLGLRIVRKIIEAHGGTIDVSSKVKVGTLINIHLKS